MEYITSSELIQSLEIFEKYYGEFELLVEGGMIIADTYEPSIMEPEDYEMLQELGWRERRELWTFGEEEEECIDD